MEKKPMLWLDRGIVRSLPKMGIISSLRPETCVLFDQEPIRIVHLGIRHHVCNLWPTILAQGRSFESRLR